MTFAAVKQASLQRSPVVRAIFALRSIPSRLRGTPAPPRDERGILEETLSLGWGVLAETPDREIVIGAVTQPWKADVVFRALPPEEFATFSEPGYVKIRSPVASARHQRPGRRKPANLSRPLRAPRNSGDVAIERSCSYSGYALSSNWRVCCTSP